MGKGKKKHPYARAPFPAAGGKSAVAEMVWSRLGHVRNFVAPAYRGSDSIIGGYYEPFANSIALLLANPEYDWENECWLVKHPPLETVNDLDAFIANFWRSVANDPEATAHWANWPVSEPDLHGRHRWLVQQHDFVERMMRDPDFYDPKIAGWWVWGACLWIGRMWCSVDYTHLSSDTSVWLPRPHVSGSGMGVNGRRLSQQKPVLNGKRNTGVYVPGNLPLESYFEALANRLRGVRILCGDWSRAVTDVVTWNNNSTRGKEAITTIVFDPPYAAEAGRTEGIYAQDDLEVSHKVREWCLEWVEFSDGFVGYRYDHPKLRIALCGYEDEHGPHMPDTWECVTWKAHGGYENQNKNKTEEERNRNKERVWFSPNCIRPDELAVEDVLPLWQGI